MVMKTSSNKRPCSVCGKWFTADLRARGRQRCCGSAECRRVQRSRTQARWRKRHPEAGAAWRLRMKVAEREVKQARSGPLERAPPPEMREVPWEWAKDEMGIKVTVMLGFLTRHLLRARKDECERKSRRCMRNLCDSWRQAEKTT